MLARRAAAADAVLGEHEVVDASFEGTRDRDETSGEAARLVMSDLGLRRGLAQARGRGDISHVGGRWARGALARRAAAAGAALAERKIFGACGDCALDVDVHGGGAARSSSTRSTDVCASWHGLRSR